MYAFRQCSHHVCDESQKSRATLSNRLKNSTQIIDIQATGYWFFCVHKKPAAGRLLPARVVLRLHLLLTENTMKTLIVLTALVVGGIQLGFKAFDAGVETAQQSHTAEMIKARHAL